MTHDSYGKRVLAEAAGDDVVFTGPSIQIDYKPGIARIDAVVGEKIAVEVESRVAKQVRGAIMDLLWHRCSRKLLILIPAHIGEGPGTVKHCESVLAGDVPRNRFRVVLLNGTGRSPRTREDALKVVTALRDLGWSGA